MHTADFLAFQKHKMPGVRGSSAQQISLLKSISNDRLAAMMDSDSEDEIDNSKFIQENLAPANNNISPSNKNLSESFNNFVTGKMIECDNCGLKFKGSIPAEHLYNCKNIPIKSEDKSIDELDDLDFMPGTPEIGENKEPVFRLGSNYPSGFGSLLVNAIQDDLKHNGWDDSNETLEGPVETSTSEQIEPCFWLSNLANNSQSNFSSDSKNFNQSKTRKRVVGGSYQAVQNFVTQNSTPVCTILMQKRQV